MLCWICCKFCAHKIQLPIEYILTDEVFYELFRMLLFFCLIKLRKSINNNTTCLTKMRYWPTTQNAQCLASLALIQSACKLQWIYRRFYKIFRNQIKNFLRILIAFFVLFYGNILRVDSIGKLCEYKLKLACKHRSNVEVKPVFLFVREWIFDLIAFKISH